MKKTKKTKVVRNIFFIALCVGLFFTSMYGIRCGFYKMCEIEMLSKFVRHDVTILMPKGAIQVEVAQSKASRELGLSGRPSMGNDEGILFVFDAPGKYGFWMNESGLVVDIERNLTPDSYPKTFINEVDASYVLEINAGLAKEFGLFLGSKVKITD